jgi:hypothetical protein
MRIKLIHASSLLTVTLTVAALAASDPANTFGSYRINVAKSSYTLFSNGGKTMTVTIKGTNADGQAFTQVLVFDKQ